MKKTTAKSNFNFDYLDKILTDWHERKLKTPAEVNSYLLETKNKNQSIKKLEKQTGYNNYEQRDFSNWDNFYANNNINLNNIKDTKIANNLEINNAINADSNIININNFNNTSNNNSNLKNKNIDGLNPLSNFTNNNQ